MTKAEEILEKHLAIMNAETMIGKHGRTHKAVINAINEAINYTRCSLQLLCVDTDYFKDLTLNKKYELIDDNPLDYTIIDDNNERCRYPKRLFEISKQ